MRTWLAIASLGIVALAAVGCPPSGAPVQPPPPPPPGSGYQPGAADGAACDVNADCASGVCEGEGCGADGGRCVAANRACTMDAVAYCGCDGQTFTSSGSCPGRRFASRGACGEASAKPDGAPCATGTDCASGVCEGQGCGADALGTCARRDRACTMNLAPYCGCDGQTFTASGSCPGVRFAARGACPSVAQAPTPAPDGAACLADGECASGVCEGRGCGADTPGTCAAAHRGCTKDLRSYCGCDGKTFRASGSCPGRRFAAPGACTQ